MNLSISPYVARAVRTEDQVLLDLEHRARERERFYTNDQRVAALESVLHYLSEAHKWLVMADSMMGPDRPLRDELAGSHDLQSDVRGQLRHLR